MSANPYFISNLLPPRKPTNTSGVQDDQPTPDNNATPAILPPPKMPAMDVGDTGNTSNSLPAPVPKNILPPPKMPDTNISGMTAPESAPSGFSSPSAIRSLTPPASSLGVVNVPDKEGYRAQAEAELGAQKKRGFGQVLKDIGLGLAGGLANGGALGGVAGALTGGIAGGDLRRENQIQKKAGDLREADQVQAQDQARQDKLYDLQRKYDDEAEHDDLERQKFEQNKQDFELRRQAQLQKLQQDSDAAKTNYDIVTGMDDQGNYNYYKKTANGLEQVQGVRAPIPKGQQAKIGDAQIKAEAHDAAIKEFNANHPGGMVNPQALQLAKSLGYDDSKPANDPNNVQAMQGVALRFPNIRQTIDPENTPEYKALLANHTARLYRQYNDPNYNYNQNAQRSNTSTATQQPARPTAKPSPQNINALRQRYQQAMKQAGNDPNAAAELRQHFKDQTGQDLDAGGVQPQTQSKPAPATQLPVFTAHQQPRQVTPPKAPAPKQTPLQQPALRTIPPPQPKPTQTQDRQQPNTSVMDQPDQEIRQTIPAPKGYTRPPTQGYDAGQTRAAQAEYERITQGGGQFIPPNGSNGKSQEENIKEYLRQKYPRAKYLSKQEENQQRWKQFSGVFLDPNNPNNQKYMPKR